jgi:iron complex transport system ATP-binding protein
MSSLHGEGLRYTVPGRPEPILAEVRLAITPGRVTGLLGPNGSGKSTLLHLLAGVLTPTAGTVLVDRHALDRIPRRERARTLAMMEQSSDTDTDLTVRDVVALGRLPHRGRLAPETPQDTAACARALAAVGMTGTERRRWRTLSGGERQRVQAARALAQEPAVLLLDEPTNHLDIRHQHQLLALLTRLADAGTTVVVVLHDLALAAQYCDDAVVLAAGGVDRAGPTAEVLTADTLRRVFGVEARIGRAGERVSVQVVGVAET